MGRRLEDLYAVWGQLFVRYWTSEASLARRFEGKNSIRSTRRHYKVVLMRNRDQYIAALRQAEPLIAMTLGYYVEKEHTSFFYSGDDQAEATWFHEGTHQLFQETRRVSNGVGRDRNFWVVEAAALYMESIRRMDGYCTIGGVESARLQYARNRTLSGQFYVPLKELAGMGREQLQQNEKVRLLYSQMAGLGHFLMDDDHGRYRRALVDYLRAVYDGRDRADTLPDLAGISTKQLDLQYRQFLTVTDDDLARIPPGVPIKKLALGRTEVTDKGLARLSDVAQLTWLDLSHTAVSDAGLAKLGDARKLTDLGLERTQVTDASMPLIGRLTRLTELDLSETAITDAGAKHLKNLTRMKTLWLTGTKITDEALRHLRGLTELEYLNVNGTGVSPEGYRQLSRALPALKDK